MKTIYKKDIKAMVKKIWGDDIAGAFDSLTDKEGGGGGGGRTPFLLFFFGLLGGTDVTFGKKVWGIGRERVYLR